MKQPFFSFLAVFFLATLNSCFSPSLPKGIGSQGGGLNSSRGRISELQSDQYSRQRKQVEQEMDLERRTDGESSALRRGIFGLLEDSEPPNNVRGISPKPGF